MLLHEITFTPKSRQPSIRPDDGVIEGVRILGRNSKNGRTYSDKAMREAAKFYDGCEVNIDHPGDKSRSSAVMERGLAEGFGELRNISVRDDGVYGDLHYLKSHPMAPQVVERAERFPSKVGLSHNAEGEVSTRGSRTVVEGIRRVISVDVVARPATNRSLFESEANSMTRTTVRQIVERLFPARAARLLREVEDAAAADKPVDVPSEATADEEIKAAFRAMVMAVFDDEGLDAQATLQKIRDILRSQEKLLGGSSSNSGTGNGASPPDELEEEVASLQQRLAAKEAELESRALLESLDIEADQTRLAALAAVPADLRSELARSWQPAGSRSTRPAVSAPLYEDLGRDAAGSVPDWKDTTSFLTSITR